MHFKISYLVTDRTIYIFIAILSRYAASNNTSTVPTTTNATITSTISSPSTTNTIQTSVVTSPQSISTSTQAATSTNTSTSKSNTTAITSTPNNTSYPNTSTSPISANTTVGTTYTSSTTTNSISISTLTTNVSISAHTTNTATNVTSFASVTTTRTSTTANATMGFTITFVNATVGQTVNFTANCSDAAHHQTTWLLLYNNTQNKTTEHELCKTSSSHQTKHHWFSLCYNCSKITLMLYNVTHNDSRRYVFKPETSCNTKPQAFELTVIAGNGTSYSNITPEFCRFTSSTPPTSSSAVDVYLQDVAAPATHAVWALALVITVVVVLMFGQGKMKRIKYYRQRHSDDTEQLVVRYRPERKRLTTGYEQMYISS
ncbi:Rh173 [macacine betaherpesvirus 3]|nr:Rh173 [macacine betaherpesvirus 3]